METVHRLEEDEFDLETLSSRGELLAKAQTYQLYFHLVLPNFHEGIYSTQHAKSSPEGFVYPKVGRNLAKLRWQAHTWPGSFP